MEIVRSVLGALEFDPVIFLSQLALFYLLHLLLTPILYKPLQSVRAQRQALTGGKVEEAEKLNAQALELKAKYESELRQAKVQALAVVAKAREEAEAARTARLDDARAQAEAVIEQAHSDVVRDMAQAREALVAQVPAMGQAVALQLLKSLSSGEHSLRMIKRVKEASK